MESEDWIQERGLWKLRSGPESGTRIMESRVWIPESERSGIWSLKSPSSDVWSRSLSLESGFWNLESGVRIPRSGVCSLEF